jgi:predicted transcriptional regulator
VATLNVIRRWALRDQMSIREISRRTGLARNTVKKHLRSEESEPKYPRRVSSSKLDPYAEKLATWLGNRGNKIAETAAHFEADPHTQPKKEKTKNLSTS